MHPLTKIRFDGYGIAGGGGVEGRGWGGAVVRPEGRVGGWGVAISNKGPLLIEANRRPGFDLVQVLEDKGCKYMLEAISKASK